MKRPTCVLTIAGSDSGAGAGVQADARTIHAHGLFACMAITAITEQNTRGVRSWEPVSPSMIAGQIGAVLGAGANDGSLRVRAIKTGLLPGAAAIRATARAVRPHLGIPLVVDPVIGSTSGTRFLDAAGLRALRKELLPLATLVTPNWPEAEALSGRPIRDFKDATLAALALAEAFGCAVLVKGGHAPGEVCRDLLVMRDGGVKPFESKRIATRNTHGTGCVLSAAIASELAGGASLATAVERARLFLLRGLRRGANTDWGGAGPAFG